MAVTQKPVTAEELLRTPDVGLRRELVRGEVRTNPRAKTVTVRLSEREARIFSEEEVLDGGRPVPGWKLPVADVFR